MKSEIQRLEGKQDTDSALGAGTSWDTGTRGGIALQLELGAGGGALTERLPALGLRVTASDSTNYFELDMEFVLLGKRGQDSPTSELANRSWDYPIANFVGAFHYPRWPDGYGIGTTALGGHYVARFF